MRISKRRYVYLIALIITLLLSKLDPTIQKTQLKTSAVFVSPTSIITITPQITQNVNTFLVKRVIDGDTIELSTGEKVRYIGVNTPELSNRKKLIDCFAQEAAIVNKNLVEGKMVKLEKDVSNVDKYGRLLRYVYIDTIFVNDYLVRKGFAQVATYPPDVKYQKLFLASQKVARKEKIGLWKTCKTPRTISPRFHF